MTALIAVLAAALILAGVAYDTARLITPSECRMPPPAAPCTRFGLLEETQFLGGVATKNALRVLVVHAPHRS